jgi:hypothetical protein
MRFRRVLLATILSWLLAPLAQAQIKHIEMRVEGMT